MHVCSSYVNILVNQYFSLSCRKIFSQFFPLSDYTLFRIVSDTLWPSWWFCSDIHMSYQKTCMIIPNHKMWQIYLSHRHLLYYPAPPYAQITHFTGFIRFILCIWESSLTKFLDTIRVNEFNAIWLLIISIIPTAPL